MTIAEEDENIVIVTFRSIKEDDAPSAKDVRKRSNAATTHPNVQGKLARTKGRKAKKGKGAKSTSLEFGIKFSNKDKVRLAQPIKTMIWSLPDAQRNIGN